MVSLFHHWDENLCVTPESNSLRTTSQLVVDKFYITKQTILDVVHAVDNFFNCMISYNNPSNLLLDQLGTIVIVSPMHCLKAWKLRQRNYTKDIYLEKTQR